MAESTEKWTYLTFLKIHTLDGDRLINYTLAKIDIWFQQHMVKIVKIF